MANNSQLVGRFIARPLRYLGKVWNRSITHTDAICGASTKISVYVPKADLINKRACVQVHIVNGAGRVLLRFQDGNELLGFLSQIAHLVDNADFRNTFQDFQNAIKEFDDTKQLGVEPERYFDFVEVDK